MGCNAFLYMQNEHNRQKENTKPKTSLINHSLFTGPGIYAKEQEASLRLSTETFHMELLFNNLSTSSCCCRARERENSDPTL